MANHNYGVAKLKNTNLRIAFLVSSRSINFGTSHMSRVVRKPAFCICKNKDADQLRGNRKADQRLCFRYRDNTIPLVSKSKFQASSHLLWLYSPVCVKLGRKPQRPVFSQRGPYLPPPQHYSIYRTPAQL